MRDSHLPRPLMAASTMGLSASTSPCWTASKNCTTASKVSCSEAIAREATLRSQQTAPCHPTPVLGILTGAVHTMQAVPLPGIKLQGQIVL